MCLPIPNEESVSAPHCLTAEWPLVAAVNLIAHGETPLKGQSGSVALACVLLNQEPSGLLGPPLRSPSSFGPPTERYAPAETEILLSKRLVYLLQPPTDLLLSRVGPLEWPGMLFEYQLEGIKALLSREALLLADDMGLGKTIQAIGALRILILQCRVESSLLIVPAGLVSQWRKELYLWALELRVSTVRGLAIERAWQWVTPAHVYIASYETFRSDFTDNPHSPPYLGCCHSGRSTENKKSGRGGQPEVKAASPSPGVGTHWYSVRKQRGRIWLPFSNLSRRSKMARCHKD